MIIQVKCIYHLDIKDKQWNIGIVLITTKHCFQHTYLLEPCMSELYEIPSLYVYTYQLYIVSELMLKNFENFSIISNMAKECIYKKFFLSFLNRLNVVFKQNYNNSKYPIPSDTWDLWKRSKAICYPLQSMTALSNSLLHDFYFNFFFHKKSITLLNFVIHSFMSLIWPLLQKVGKYFRLFKNVGGVWLPRIDKYNLSNKF